MPLTRYKVTIEYDGGYYSGFQIQNGLKTVASALTEAVYKISHEQPKITCTGRTDAGVHAEGQVVHFDLNKQFSEHQLTEALNFHLKSLSEAVIAKKCEIVNFDFDARRSSKTKIYRYQILNRSAPSILLKDRIWHIRKPLDIIAMKQAANYLIGEHDFSSFRASGCQAKHPIRYIEYIKISKQDELILLHIKGNAFLYNMVRIIVGSLVKIGLGDWPADRMLQILKSKDRTTAGATAPAAGLYLQEVIFD